MNYKLDFGDTRPANHWWQFVVPCHVYLVIELHGPIRWGYGSLEGVEIP
jgi:hypothetical protein